MGLGEWLQKKKAEADARKQWEEEVRRQNYPAIYKQEYKKKLRRETRQRFAPQRFGGFRGGLRSSGLLQPDTSAINRALYGDFLNPSAPINRRLGSRSKIGTPKKHRKKIVIYT